MSEEAFRHPIRLSGVGIELAPLEASHAAELRGPAADPEISRYLRSGPWATPEALDAEISVLLRRQSEGTDLPFTVLARSSGRAIGMTRYLRIDRENRSVEIGGTWYAREYWRTSVNTEAKSLLLRQAFDTEHVNRVQFQTDERNVRSRRAILRLGAIQEGTLRDDVVLADGYRRSSVYYSILRSEWPAVRRALEEKLAGPPRSVGEPPDASGAP